MGLFDFLNPVLAVAGLITGNKNAKAANNALAASGAASEEAARQMAQGLGSSSYLQQPVNASILLGLLQDMGVAQGSGANTPVDQGLFDKVLRAASGWTDASVPVPANLRNTYGPAAQSAMNLMSALGLTDLYKNAGVLGGGSGVSTLPGGGSGPPAPGELSFPASPSFPGASAAGGARTGGGYLLPASTATGRPVGQGALMSAAAPAQKALPAQISSQAGSQTPAVKVPRLPAVGEEYSMGQDFLRQGATNPQMLQQAANDWLAQQSDNIERSYQGSLDQAAADLGAMGRKVSGSALADLAGQRAGAYAQAKAQAPYAALSLQQAASDAAAARAGAAGALQSADNATSALGRSAAQAGQYAQMSGSQNQFMQDVADRANIALRTLADQAGLNLGIGQSNAGLASLPSALQQAIAQAQLGTAQAGAGMQALPAQTSAAIAQALSGMTGAQLQQLRDAAAQAQVPLESFINELALRAQGQANQLGYEQAASQRSLVPSQTLAQYLQYASAPGQIAQSNAANLMGLLGMALSPQTDPAQWLQLAQAQQAQGLASAGLAQQSGLGYLGGLLQALQASQKPKTSAPAPVTVVPPASMSYAGTPGGSAASSDLSWLWS